MTNIEETKYISWTNPPKKGLLNGMAFFFIFGILFLVGVVLFLMAILNEGVYPPFFSDLVHQTWAFVIGFLLFFFSSMLFAKNLKWYRKYRFARKYSVGNNGVEVIYNNEKTLYKWEDIRGWARSKEVDMTEYSFASSKSGMGFGLILKILEIFSKNINPNWVKMKTQNGNILTLEVPEKHFEDLISIIEKHKKPIPPEEFLIKNIRPNKK